MLMHRSYGHSVWSMPCHRDIMSRGSIMTCGQHTICKSSWWTRLKIGSFKPSCTLLTLYLLKASRWVRCPWVVRSPHHSLQPACLDGTRGPWVAVLSGHPACLFCIPRAECSWFGKINKSVRTQTHDKIKWYEMNGDRFSCFAFMTLKCYMIGHPSKIDDPDALWFAAPPLECHSMLTWEQRSLHFSWFMPVLACSSAWACKLHSNHPW